MFCDPAAPSALIGMDQIPQIARLRSAEPELRALAKDYRGLESPAYRRMLEILRTAWREDRQFIKDSFEQGIIGGRECASSQSNLTDDLVGLLADVASEQIFAVDNFDLAIVPVGGYGRAELAPYSDIDVLFLLPHPGSGEGRRTATEQLVEFVLYTLWNLNLPVGQSVRSLRECIQQSKDSITRTSLLESRLLRGNKKLFAKLQNQLEHHRALASKRSYIEDKQRERELRHQQTASRYALEPDVKEGKGGLRDLQSLMWIARYLYRAEDIRELVEKGVFTKPEARRFDKALLFLWTIRCHLHYLAGRRMDRLSFEFQQEVGEKMRYTSRHHNVRAERLMKRYFLVAADVGHLTRLFFAAQGRTLSSRLQGALSKITSLEGARLQEGYVEGFRLQEGYLNFSSNDNADRPLGLLRIFRVAQLHNKEIHPQALSKLKRAGSIIAGLRDDPKANQLFMSIMLEPKRNPATGLKMLHEAGVLGRFIPEFGRIIAQMQYDLYHAFTVDEHTLLAVDVLYQLETQQSVSRAFQEEKLPCTASDYRLAKALMQDLVRDSLSNRRVIYLAVLLHDIAKGRGGDHSKVGSKIARKLCQRLGLDSSESLTVAWLVSHHLDMPHTAFKRDLDDHQTIKRFLSESTASLELLKMLLVLTVADISAVAPGCWNSWKESLLTELYHRAEGLLTQVPVKGEPIARIRRAKLRFQESQPDWSGDELQQFLELGGADFWLSFRSEDHVRFAETIRRARGCQQLLAVELHTDDVRKVSEITVYAKDRHQLFSDLAGAVAICGVNIVEARICTLRDATVLCSFLVQDPIGEAIQATSKREQLCSTVSAVAQNQLDVRKELVKARSSRLSKSARVFKGEAAVTFDHKTSAGHIPIEVSCRDRLGLLHDLASTLSDLGLKISSARVLTYGNRAVDVFYVEERSGIRQGMSPERESEIRTRLLEQVD